MTDDTQQQPSRPARAVESAEEFIRRIGGLLRRLSDKQRAQLLDAFAKRDADIRAAERAQALQEAARACNSLADEKVTLSRKCSANSAAREPVFWKSEGIREAAELIDELNAAHADA